MKNILLNNIRCCNSNDQIDFTIFYNRNTITNLITKNNQGPPTPTLKKTQLIYQYTCKHENCELQNDCYIGQTNTTLSRRLTMRLASGGPKQHHLEKHYATLTRKKIVDNTKIIRTERDTYRLSILESLLIKNVKPNINNQMTGPNINNQMAFFGELRF